MSTSATRATRSTTSIALVAVFAAVIAVCSVAAALPIGINGVPVTLQMFGVFLAGAVLGAWRGFLAVLLYLVLGLAGLPVFAGGMAGLAPFAGPTAGYLLTFPLAAAIVGLIVQLLARRGLAVRAAAIVAGGLLAELVVWLGGALGISLYAGTPYLTTLAGAAVYLPADLLKLGVAAVVGAAVHRAFPDLLSR